MRKIVNGNEVTLETSETFATVKIETPNGLYEAKKLPRPTWKR